MIIKLFIEICQEFNLLSEKWRVTSSIEEDAPRCAQLTRFFTDTFSRSVQVRIS